MRMSSQPCTRGERLGDFGLADARLALDQQRALEVVHHPERGREIAVGDIADLGETRRDRFAGDSGARHADTAGVPLPRLRGEGRGEGPAADDEG